MNLAIQFVYRICITRYLIIADFSINRDEPRFIPK